jgi:hypothetical protein
MATALDTLRRRQEPRHPKAKRVRRGFPSSLPKKQEAKPEDATRLRRIKAGVPLDLNVPAVDLVLECFGDLGVSFVEHKSLKEPEAPTQIGLFGGVEE